jgi:hypothetical protein
MTDLHNFRAVPMAVDPAIKHAVARASSSRSQVRRSSRGAHPPPSAVSPTPTYAGNEKYLAGFWIIEASGLDAALELATEWSKACNRRVEVRRYAAKAADRA